MRKAMIAFAAAFAVCTATMTSGTTAAFARGGGSIGAGTHGFGGGGFGGHGFVMGRSDGGHFGRGFGHLGRGFRDRRFGRFGFGLYGYASGSYYNYGYGACSAPPPNGNAWACTDIQHRNLLSALHPRRVRRLDQPLGRQTRSLPYATCDKHTATYGDVTRTLLAFVGACPELSW